MELRLEYIGEHGVGIGKKEYLEKELGMGTVALLKKLKRVLDPQNIMVRK
jgi:D-lactate dehydrogenase (cytochrome)